MPADSKANSGLFSSLSLDWRSSNQHQQRSASTSSEPFAHPLLGASASTIQAAYTESPDSYEALPLASDGSPLKYKPRQRHAGHTSVTPTSSPGPSAGAVAAASSSSTSPSSTSNTTSVSIGVSAPIPSTATLTTNAIAPSAAEGSHDDMSVPLSVPSATASATSRLQLTSLKAAAQRIGLGNASMGAGIIDAIFEKGARARSEGSDWADVLKVLTTGKAIILLPSSPASSLPTTPQTLRDHVAFLSPAIALPKGSPAQTASVLVTLSGLIGTMRGSTVSFESTVPHDSSLIQALKNDHQRARVLSTLRPTELFSASLNGFPSYTVSADSTSLSFPPLGRGLPPGFAEKLERKDKEQPSGRRINPFASLFGGSNAQTVASSGVPSPSRGLSPERAASPSPGASHLSSPQPSFVSLEGDSSPALSDSHNDGYSVVAYVINKPIRYTEVHKALVKAVRYTVRQELEGLPSKVVDKTLKLVVSSVCPIGSGGSVDQALLKSHHHGLGSAEADGGVPLDFNDPTGCGERLQDFMEAIYDDLFSHFRSELPSKDSETKVTAEQYIEDASSVGTERVEGLVCRMLYNRIFSPLVSDDARHDEALASRIAALNMLDLSLEHLGLITRPPNEPVKGAIAKGLAVLIDKIGNELQLLSSSSCLTPKHKADVLVRAHKIAVDGLAQLPPIKLRPEDEPYVAPPPEEEAEEVDQAPEDESTETMSSVEENNDKTPVALRTARSEPVPEFDLSSSGGTGKALQSAISDSVGTIVPPKDEGLEDNMGTTETSTVTEATPRASTETSGADVILPIIIYAVVKSNPAQLASQLMYLRRYRSAICLEGEASYAIVNLTAVVEFIEHVQLADLGLGDDSGKVMSVEDLSPIGLNYLDGGNEDAASIASASTRLRGRVFQVGELAGSAAGSANRVITGVVDSSLSALRGFISSGPPSATLPSTEESQVVPPQKVVTRARQSSTFSLASVTASVANIAANATAARNRSRASSHASESPWPGNQERELVEVVPSRPESVREQHSPDEDGVLSEDNESPSHGVLDSDSEVNVFGGSRHRAKSDSRSIMSVSSMMSRDTGSREGYSRSSVPSIAEQREPIGNRLASSIGAIGTRLATPPVPEVHPAATAPTPDARPGFFAALTSRSGAPGARRPSSLGPAALDIRTKSTPASSPPPSLSSVSVHPSDIDGPVERFMTCDVGDIRLNEVGALLKDYRRLACVLAKLQQQGGT